MLDRDTIFHYCSPEAFLGILESKSLFLSSLTQSNDSLEGTWAIHLIRNISRSDPALLNLRLDDLIRFLEIDRTDIFGVCFSQDGDTLSQWRAYADDGRGFSIGFSKTDLRKFLSTQKECDYFIREVTYDPDKQNKVVMSFIYKWLELGNSYENVIDNILREQKNNFNNPLFDTIIDLYCLKNPAFQEEREYRIINIRSLTPRDIFPHPVYSPRDDVRFRVQQGRIKPYIVLSLEEATDQFGNKNSFIKSIVSGPKNMSSEGTINTIIFNNNYFNVRHLKSSSSYR